MKELPRVAIVYLSYNSLPYIEEVFSSVRELNYPKDKLEVIVVDNNSNDGSVEKFHEMNDITFMPKDTNPGFAGGNNIGIEHALLNDAKYVFLQNNDLKLHPDSILEAVKLAEEDETIGSVQSTMLYWQDESKVNSTGGMVHFLGFGYVRDNGRKWDEVKSEVRDGEEIAYASGAAVLFRSSVLQQVGLLDTYFFMYHEDLELGWRIRLAGYKNVLSTKSIAYHHYEFKRSISKFYSMERNRYLVHLSHLRPISRLCIFPLMLLMEPLLMLFAIKGGWAKEKLLVWIELLRPSSWKYVRRKRKESNAMRVVSDKEIVRLFTSRVEHQETDSFIVSKIGNPLLSIIWWFLKKVIR